LYVFDYLFFFSCRRVSCPRMNEPVKYFATLRPVFEEGTRKAFDRGHVFLMLIELQANQVVV
jgi:hypothetical protein